MRQRVLFPVRASAPADAPDYCSSIPLFDSGRRQPNGHDGSIADEKGRTHTEDPNGYLNHGTPGGEQKTEAGQVARSASAAINERKRGAG